MIDTKELMIGNYVLVGNRLEEVYNIHQDKVNLSYSLGDYEGGCGSDYYEEPELINAIPLTEQILLDCGFEKDEEVVFDIFHLDGIGLGFHKENWYPTLYQYNVGFKDIKSFEVKCMNIPVCNYVLQK